MSLNLLLSFESVKTFCSHVSIYSDSGHELSCAKCHNHDDGSALSGGRNCVSCVRHQGGLLITATLQHVTCVIRDKLIEHLHRK